MATEKELKAIMAPLLARYPDWQYSRGWLFRMPIGYYLRGIALSGSWSSREHFLVKRSVYPLFESPHGIHSSWGRSRPIPGTPSHNWNVFHPCFPEKLIELIEQEVLPITARIAYGSDFLRYLTENYTEHGWQDWGKALGYVHMGKLETARDLLKPLAALFETLQFERLKRPDAWGHNLLEILRLIEEDPGAIPAHCEAVARQSVKVIKLEKYWEATALLYEHAENAQPT